MAGRVARVFGLMRRGAAMFTAATLAMASAAASAANLVGHGGPVRAIAVAEDGRTALSGSFDYSMILWRLDGPASADEWIFDDHDGAVNAVAFVDGSDRALSGSDDGAVRIWNLAGRELVYRFEGHTQKVVALALSPDGRIAASAGWDRTVRLWDLEELRPLTVLHGHTGNVNAVAFSVDGTALYSASYDGTIREWRVRDGAFVRIVYDHGWGVNVLQRLPGSGMLLFGSLDGTVGLVDPGGDDAVRILDRREGPVLAIAVSSQDALAAAGGADGHITVWSTEDWSETFRHENPYGPIWALAFSGDGHSLYYGGLDDYIVHLALDRPPPLDAREGDFPRRFQVSRDLSLGERQFARKCSVCHTLTPDGANRAGPTLYDLFGRRAGTLPGYSYSDALKDSDIVWTEETVADLFADGPEYVVPGSKMPLQRMTSQAERDALIAFLKEATKVDPGRGSRSRDDEASGDTVR